MLDQLRTAVLAAHLLVLAVPAIAAAADPLPPSYGGPADYVTGAEPVALAHADLDADGDEDLVILNSVKPPVTVLLNQGDGTFVQGGQYGDGYEHRDLVTVDLDGDGDEDVATITAPKNGLAWGYVLPFLNDGTGVMTMGGASLGSWGVYVSLAAGDLDGDGDIDLVAADEAFHTVDVFQNDGNAGFGTPVELPVGYSPSSVVVGDLDRDGDLDVLAANTGTNTLSLVRNTGGASFMPAQHMSLAASSPSALAIGDVDSDTDLDVAVVHLNGTVRLLVNDGTGSFLAAGDYKARRVARDIEFADLNGDHLLDLVVAAPGTPSRSVQVFLNKGGGQLQAAIPQPTGFGPSAITVADFNGDGSADLATTNHWDESVSVLLSDGPRLIPEGFPAIGTTMPLRVFSPSDAGLPYACGFAFGTSPGITLGDGRVFPLNADALLVASLAPNSVFQNTMGVLDGTGTATVDFVIPNDPAIAGFTIHGAFVAFDAKYPSGIKTVSPARSITLVPASGGTSVQAPIAQAVFPEVASYFYQTPITVTGKGFLSTPNVSVAIGGTQATSVQVLSDSTLTCVAQGAPLPGKHDLVVTSPAGAATLVDGMCVAHKVRVSLKALLSPSGYRHFTANTDELVNKYFGDCDRITWYQDRWIWYGLEEVIDVNQPQYYQITSKSQSYSLANNAVANPSAYGWRTDAINAYFNATHPHGGMACFPWGETTCHGIIILASGAWGFPTNSPVLDHEIGHYFGLRHTHDPQETIPDTPYDPYDEKLGLNQSLVNLANLYGVGTPDYVTLRHNVMSYYYPIKTTEALMTPLQSIATVNTLQASRMNVIYW